MPQYSRTSNNEVRSASIEAESFGLRAVGRHHVALIRLDAGEVALRRRHGHRVAAQLERRVHGRGRRPRPGQQRTFSSS